MQLFYRTLTTSVCLLVMIALKPSIVTSMVTSFEKLRNLATDGDRPLVQAIEDKIQLHLDKLRKLTNLLAEHSKKGMGPHQLKINHPNDFYLMIKHYSNAWASQDTDSAVLDEVIRSKNIKFPTSNDLEEAWRALIRLQFVYQLNASDMFKGNYSGYMGSPLDMEDAYLLGQHATATGYLNQGLEWLQVSANALHNALTNQSSVSKLSGDQQPVNFQYVMTLALMGRVYFYGNNTEMARKIYDQCTASGVTNVGDVEALREELEAKNPEEFHKKYVLNHLDTDHNVSILCSREKEHRLAALRPYHVCRYKRDAFLPYNRFREEILSTSPYVSLFYDVIHDPEIRPLKDLAKRELKRGKTEHSNGTGIISEIRTGDLSWIFDEDDPVAARVSHRVKAFTGLEVFKDDGQQRSAEALQVLNYGLGGHYAVHLDALGQWPKKRFQDRLATVLFYMTDVEKGGATVFPKLGLSVSPKKGMALLWYSYKPDHQEEDQNTLHAGCPVMIGNKWIANKWIWTYGNTFRRPCGATPKSQQLDLEKVVTINALKAI